MIQRRARNIIRFLPLGIAVGIIVGLLQWAGWL